MSKPSILPIEEYLEQAETTLRAFSCSTDLASQWRSRLDMYRQSGTSASAAVTRLLEMSGLLEDE